MKEALHTERDIDFGFRQSLPTFANAGKLCLKEKNTPILAGQVAHKNRQEK